MNKLASEIKDLQRKVWKSELPIANRFKAVLDLGSALKYITKEA